MEVLSDMVRNPIFPEEELEKEKKVVLEEMKMYRDSPDDVIFEEFSGRIFRGHPLGRPVLGFENTVSSFTRENLFDYMNERYRPDNLLVAVAGNVNHEDVVEDRKSTRLNSSHVAISYAVFCLKKKKI